MTAQRPTYLAIDLGASSGRAVVGTLDEDGMHVEEVHRFRTPLNDERGSLRWDLTALTDDILRSLSNGLARSAELRSVSVDSWGVDYVPLAADGTLVRDVYAYRDQRTAGRMCDAGRLIGAERLYDLTGIQFLDINTLPQILADIDDEPDLLSRTSSRLLIADYFLFRLCGVGVAERTLASTTQLMDVRTGEWSLEILNAIGDTVDRWPRIVAPGTSLGLVHAALLPTSVRPGPMVVAACSHDTAAAVAAVPAVDDRPWAFISSGTWSLVGAEIQNPILSTGAREAGFTNESGIDGTIRFLKNRMGLWVFEECAREWMMAGNRAEYEALMAAAELAPSGAATIDLNTPELAKRGPMIARLAAAFAEQGIVLPTDRAGIVRLILESMAASYREAIDELDALLGRRSEVIHIVGGGSRIRLLNRLAADACGRRIVAGPAEATVLGNLLVQARTVGDLPAGLSIRQLAARSATLEVFEPSRRTAVGAPAVSTH